MEKLTDNQILDGLRSHDQKENDRALKAIYAQCYPVVARYLKKNSGSKEDMDDIFQDAIIVFYNKVRKEEFNLHCTVLTYVFSVCKKLWLYRLRNQKRNMIVEADLTSISIEDNQLSIITSNEKKILVANLMSKLGDGCKAILLHYYFNKIRMKDIAPLMGLQSEQAAKNKKAGCMKKLKSLVKNSPHLKTLFR